MCAYIAMKHHGLFILSDRIMQVRFLCATPFRILIVYMMNLLLILYLHQFIMCVKLNGKIAK